MEEQVQNPKAGQGLGIAGLVLGILAAVVSFIPCLGMYAIFPGVVALILAIVAFMQANKGGAPKGMIIAALVLSLVGSGIAVWQYFAIKAAASQFENMGKELLDSMQKMQQNLPDSLK